MLSKFLYLSLFLISLKASAGNCDQFIKSLKERDIKLARVELNNNCDARSYEVEDEFGDSKNINLQIAFSNVVRHYPDCKNAFISKNIPELRKCFEEKDINSMSEIIDAYFTTEFKKELDSWRDLLELKKKESRDAAAKAKKAKEELAAQEKVREDKVKQERLKNGTDLKEQACTMDFLIRRNHKFIENENEVGKVSGYVNKNKLHKWGTEIVAFKKHLSKTEKDFTDRTGKAISLKDCKDPFRLD